MAEPLKLYLDQMLRLDVAQALRDEGHDVMCALSNSTEGQSCNVEKCYQPYSAIFTTLFFRTF